MQSDQSLLRICYEKVVSLVSPKLGEGLSGSLPWCEGHLLNEKNLQELKRVIKEDAPVHFV